MFALWRISNRCDLEGAGGERAPGRWHTTAHGKRIVYLSEHPAVALVEGLAHLHGDASLLPESYQLIKVALPEATEAETVEPPSLAGDWRDDLDLTRSIGDQWLHKQVCALLIVPSAPAPESRNYLLNPLHKDAKGLQIEWCRHLKFDRRFFKILDK